MHSERTACHSQCGSKIRMKIQLGGYYSCGNPRYADENNAILYESTGFYTVVNT
jgi:hypothetical protein